MKPDFNNLYRVKREQTRQKEQDKTLAKLSYFNKR